MGMYGLSTRAWTAIGLMAVLIVAGVASFTVGPFSIGDVTGDDPGDGVGFDTVATDEYDINAEIRLGEEITGDAYLFVDQPDADNPVNHGDYVDFDADEATSGLSEGEDYYQASLSGDDVATFDNPDAGTYHAVLVDQSSPQEYHYEFFSVEMPDRVESFKVEQDQPVILARSDQFTRMAEYDDDDIVTLDSTGSVVSLDASFDDHTGTIEDRERTVEHTINVDRGEAYLGELVTSSEDLSDVSEIEATVEVDGAHIESEMLVDGSEEEFGSLDLADEMETDPVTAGDTVTVTYDVVYDAQEGDAGEAIMTGAVEDIYGNEIGDGEITIERGTGSAE